MEKIEDQLADNATVIERTDPGLSGEIFGRAVEWDLTRLSVAAFAMFNRNRQWVTETDLDADLLALLGEPAAGQSVACVRS
ncbi:hypothetical protein [Actinophytocola sp.]|uniref:hypothetical protein n=1 Tax=Actinophytocola sp. TaxID=1872138 RepID=UPI003D6A6FA4